MRPAPLMILGAALAALLAAPAAWSARPLVSETADSLARGDCELETAVASTRVRPVKGSICFTAPRVASLTYRKSRASTSRPIGASRCGTSVRT